MCRAHSAGITVSTLGRHLPFLWVCSEPQNLLQPRRFSVHEPQMEHLNHSREHRGVARECPKPSVPQPCLAERGLAGTDGEQQR